MSYLTRDEFINAFGETEISRLEFNITKSSDDTEKHKASETALRNASNKADSYLVVSYDLPLPSVPDVLKTSVGDVARYLLYKDKPTEEVESRYKDALTYLKDLGAGRARLVFPVQPAGDEGQPQVGSGVFVA
jgi:phage gp36-like protein